MISKTVLRNVEQIRESFREARPFPHVCIDDFFELDEAQALLRDFPPFDEDRAKNEFGQPGPKCVITDIQSISPTYSRLYEYLSSREFLESISAMTGIAELEFDPEMYGGGTHENLSGAELDPHIDFNYEIKTAFHRRLNVLLYLNEEWSPEWGGAIELHSNPYGWFDGTDDVRSFNCVFNRCVIFETSERSWHGFRRIRLPGEKAHLSRKLISIYLYTKTRPRHEIAPPHGTFYVPYPPSVKTGQVLSQTDVDEIRRLTHKRDRLLSLAFETERKLNEQCMQLQHRTEKLERAQGILSSRKMKLVVSLALLIFLQFLFLGRRFSEFLTPDGIFYVARPIGNIASLGKLFTSLDDTQNYRPLTYVIATPLYWIAGLNTSLDHVFVFAGHILVTFLVFLLACEVTKSANAAFISAAFFGLHGAASHVAFDLAFLPDLAYGAFYILGLFAWLRAGRSGSRAWRGVSIVSFVLALFSKEPAVTFPAAVTLLSFLFLDGAEYRAWSSARLRLAFRRTAVFWVIGIVYLLGYGLLTSGSYFPTGNHPYQLSLKAGDLWSHHRYAEWALNIYPAYDTMAGHPAIVALAARVLPKSIAERVPAMSDFYLYLVGPFWMLWLLVKGQWSFFVQFLPLSVETPLKVLSVIALVYFIIRSSLRREARTLFGLGLFLFPLIPVLLLRADKTMLHNIYVPAAGISLIVGNFSLVLWRRQTRGRRLLAVIVPAVFVVMGIHGIHREQDEAWPTTSARTMKMYLEDVMHLYPTLPGNAILYFEKTGISDFPFLNGRGDVYRVFYGRPDLVTLFGDLGQAPPNPAPNQTLIRLAAVDGHLTLIP